MPPPSFRIAIIGAGITGSAAAIALALKGHQVTVFDAREKVGGKIANSIFIYPNASRVLKRYGVGAALASVSSTATKKTFRAHTGQIISEQAAGNYEAQYGSPYVQFHFGYHKNFESRADNNGTGMYSARTTFPSSGML